MAKAGLYFHIPYCRGKCPYCDFYSKKYDFDDCVEYVKQVKSEMKKYRGEVDTVYFGGGTPSLVEHQFIGEILDSARENFDIDDDSEITIECNPFDDLGEKLKKYRSFGINRVSVGMQSAVDGERKALGRRAGKSDVEKAIYEAREAGFDNISVDLMIGTPNQTMTSLDESIKFIEEMGVEHVSAYMLKLEEGTPFYKNRKRLNLPCDDVVAEMYLKMIDELEYIGLKQYEISNFSKPGFESKHNLKYWNLDEYLGLGKSAHSFWGGKRFYYDHDFQRVDDGIGGNDGEKIMLGLRLNKGIDKKLVKKDYLPFVKMGLIGEDEKNIWLTRRGMLVSNVVICELI